MRNFDLEQQFSEIKKAAVDAVKTLFPVVGKKRRLELADVWVEDKLDPTDYTQQAKAKARNGTWGGTCPR